MKYRTPKRALEVTKKIWLYLQRYPFRKKQNAYASLRLGIDFCDCPCCEFALAKSDITDSNKNYCEYCPLYPKALTPQLEGCCADGEPYQIWSEAQTGSPESLKAIDDMLTLIDQCLS